MRVSLREGCSMSHDTVLSLEKYQLLVWIEHWSQDERDERVGLSLGRVWGKEAVH